MAFHLSRTQNPPCTAACLSRNPAANRLGRLLLVLAAMFCLGAWCGKAAAAVTFQAAGTAVNGTTGVGLAVPWPAHAQGDVALLFVESMAEQPVTLSVANGFTAVANSPQATGSGLVGTQLTVFWARATSAAMQPPVLNLPTDHVYARIVTYRGVINNGNPIDVTAGGVKATASTSVIVTGVTTTVPNTLIVQAVARHNDSAAAAFSAETNVNLTSITEQLDAGTANGNGGGLGVWSGTKAVAGATGNTTANVTSSINAFLTIALKPQPGPRYQAAGNAVSNATTVSPAWPAHAINDVALLFVESGGGEAVTLSVANGFAPVTNSPQAVGAVTNGTRITVFWARATSAAMAAPTVTVPAVGNSHIYARIVTYRNVVTAGNPWDVTGGGTKTPASTVVNVSGVTTTLADTLIVQADARDTDSSAAAFSGQANASLTGIAERSDAGTTTGRGGGFAIWDGYKATAGATGNTSGTVASSINAFLTIALRPQAAIAPVYNALGAATVSGLTWPAHAVDDIALLFVESTGGQPVTLSVANGFAPVTNSPQATGLTTNGTRISVFWARATSTTMAGPVLSGTTDHVYARILTYRGAINTGNPWDVTGGGVKATASTSVTVTGVTTTIADTLVVQAVAHSADSTAAYFSAQANANLTGITVRTDAGTNTGNGGGFSVWDGAKATAGATGNTTATVTSSINAFLTIALKPGVAVPDHYELSLPTTSVACLASTVTVTACSNATNPCAAAMTTLAGQTATLAVGTAGCSLGATSVNFNAFGIATTTLNCSGAANDATVTVTLSGESTPTSPVAGSRMCCLGGTCSVSDSCSISNKTAGFIFAAAADGAEASIAAQRAGTSSGTYYLRAIQTNTSTLACEPALSGDNTVNIGYECINPAACTTSNLMSITAGTPSATTTIARNDSGSSASKTSVGMRFDDNGNAHFTLNFADAGRTRLHAAKAAGGTLLTSLAGTSLPFVTAPHDFGIAPSGPYVAGVAFTADVTARTSGGAATPNFGKESTAETATLGFVKYRPTGATAVNGSFASTLGAFGAVTAGVASGTDLAWSDVGTIDLTATLTGGSYLGSSLNVTGTTGATGAVGPFVPHHFDTAITAPTCAFAYSGQALTVTITAMNGAATPATTQNYDGSTDTSPNFAKAVTLADANLLAGGSLTGTAIAAAAFVNGVAAAAPAFTFTTVETSPGTIKLRASDADVTNAGVTEATREIRAGRLRLFNAYGSELLPLRVPVRAEYYDAGSWKRNTADSCTNLPTDAVAIGNRNPAGLGSSVTAVEVRGAGLWDIVMAVPSAPGSADVALDLGTGTAAATTCLPSWTNGPDATTGAGLSHLLGKWCGASYDKAPLARVKFGSPKAPYIYLRERY